MVDGPQFSPQEIKETRPLNGKNIAICGTSRGLGARTAIRLAEAGADILGSHTGSDRGQRRQEGVIKEAKELNPDANFRYTTCDITNDYSRMSFIAEAVGNLARPRKIDVLVLNAAGGLEEDKGEDYADLINNTSQVAMAREALPFMAPGGRIVFTQSYPGYDYGRVKQYALYDAIARTKHDGMTGLQDLAPEMDKCDVDLNIIVGDIFSDSPVFNLMKRTQRDQSRQGLVDAPTSTIDESDAPSTDDVALALRDMILSPSEQGLTRFVGKNRLEPFDQSIIGREIDSDEIAELLPMFNDHSLMVDRFKLTSMDTGTGYYRVRPKDVEGHFTGPFSEIQLMPGHWTDEMAEQAAGLVVAQTRILGTGFPMAGGGSREYNNMAFPGEMLRTEARYERAVSGGVVICCAKVYGQEDVLVATYPRIAFRVLPYYEMGLRLYRRERAARGLSPENSS